MAYFDIYTDPSDTNDVVLTDTGDFRFTKTRQESLAQRLLIRYSTFLGEWKYNTDFGTPWEQRILKGGLTQSQLDSEIKSIALDEDDVTNVKNITSTLDTANRTYTVTRMDVYCDDDEFTVPIADAATRTNSYPEPMSYSDFVVCTMDADELEAVNSLHEWLNEDMDADGDGTWWNEWTFSDSDSEIVDEAINTNFE